MPEGKEWEGVKFRGDKSDVGLGKGNIKLSVDPKGVVSGEIDGALGPGVVSGMLEPGGELGGKIAPKEPSKASEGAFYGTLVGKRAGDAIEGTMKLSQSDARVIREAKFTLKR